MPADWPAVYAPVPEIAPPVALNVTVTLTLSPVFLRPYAVNWRAPPADTVVVLGLITIWTTRRFFTLEVALSEELMRVAATSASAADVSAVYMPPDVIAPAEALQRTDTGTLSPACVRPNT